jgi:hypothetical protein
MSFTAEDLVKAVFFQDCGTMSQLLAALGVDPDDEDAMKKIKDLFPDIEERLRPGGSDRWLPKEDLYDKGSIYGDLWKTLADGNVISLGVLKACLMVSDAKFDHALAVVANPWHPENRGRSCLRRSLNKFGMPQYRLVDSVPEAIIEMCEKVWGKMPVPPKAVR